MGTERESDAGHLELDREHEQPGVEIVKYISDLENTQPTALPSIWRCIDDVLNEIFSTPPATDADMEVTFTYAGYRVTVKQNGRATFVPIE